MKRIAAFVISYLLTSNLSLASNSAYPWLAFIGDEDRLNSIRSIETQANVGVSDGLKYDTATSWQDQYRVVFNRQYPDQQAAMGRWGEYYWVYDGEKQSELNNGFREFIIGHQYHAQLLFFDQFDLATPITYEPSALCDCTQAVSTDIDNNRIALHFTKAQGQPKVLVTEFVRHGKVSASFFDWQKSDGLVLPMRILIEHDGNQFEYQYTALAFNTSEIYQRHQAPEDKLNDRQQLVKLHRDMIDAHLASDASLMAHIWADEILMVNRGEVSQVSGTDAALRMSESLQRRKHSRYADLHAPIVSLSQDGTLGTIAVSVNAVGIGQDKEGEFTQAFEFTSAWLASFEKDDGKWKMTANASNFLSD